MKNQNNAKAGRKGLIVLILIILAVLILVFGCNRGEEPQEQAAETTTQTTEAAVQTTEAAVQTEETTTQAAQVTYTFRYNDRLQDHYKKHGRDMGFASPEEYLAAANAVIANPDALTKTEKEDGDYIYYLQTTKEIVFISRIKDYRNRHFIRTYFRPSSGLEYFQRQ